LKVVPADGIDEQMSAAVSEFDRVAPLHQSAGRRGVRITHATAPVDIAIVTAKPIEREAVLARLRNVEKVTHPDDPFVFYRGQLPIPNQPDPYQVVVSTLVEHFNTDRMFLPVLEAQHADAVRKGQQARVEMFDRLIVSLKAGEQHADAMPVVSGPRVADFSRSDASP
jgi:hypothetical protein